MTERVCLFCGTEIDQEEEFQFCFNCMWRLELLEVNLAKAEKLLSEVIK